MTLNEFVESEKALLDQFVKLWEERQYEFSYDPARFPKEMDRAEWDEQYRAFKEFDEEADEVWK